MKISTSYITAALLTAVSLLSACTSTDAEEMKKYFREDYIQHNPHVPTGLAPALGFLPAL